MSLLPPLDRRTLLIGGGAGVGLVVAFALWPSHLDSELPAAPHEQAFGNYLKIARDGRVTVAVPQVETGQGIWTALPQIAADELGAAWEMVGVEPAPLLPAYANPLAKEQGWLGGFGPLRRHQLDGGQMRITAGATSIRAFEEPLRRAAAIARAMLVAAAADRWNIEPNQCETADGYVIQGLRTFSFGELAEEAADRSPPAHPRLRTSARSRLFGKPLSRLDGPAKAAGAMRFAGDVRLPDMRFASAAIAPPGGRLTGYAREAIARVPGVRHVVARDGWLAIVADTWWAADQAIRAADAKFSGRRSPPNWRQMFDEALANGDSSKWFSRGDYSKTVRGSRPLAATYYTAPSQHLGLEPLTATVRVNGDDLEVWAPAQAPGFARGLAAGAAGVSENRVTFYPMPVGEPAGRAIEPDAIPIAVALAREIGRPVQLVVSGRASQNHDRVSPGALARMAALPGAGGITAAWQMKVATADGLGSALARLAAGDLPSTLGKTALEGAIPPYGIPNVRIDCMRSGLPLAAGYMRGSPQREFAFFTESFVDELARAAGLEPVAFRMAMLGSNPRLARCIEAAAQLAQWDGGGPGSTMGVAACSAYASHIALVATASIGTDRRIKVHRLVAAVDCGRFVNSSLATQQVESGLIWGLAQATAQEAEWVAGMPRARAFDAIGLPRLADMPDFTIQLIPTANPPGGLSGLGSAVLAPAVANALFAATGKRMRSLPFEVA